MLADPRRSRSDGEVHNSGSGDTHVNGKSIDLLVTNPNTAFESLPVRPEQGIFLSLSLG